MNRSLSRWEAVPFLAGLVVAMATLTAVSAITPMSFTPKADYGYPAGMLPECPGVMKNASISQKMMPLLQIISHRLSKDGQVVRKPMPITAATKMVAKDKMIDFKNKKTVVYAVGFMDSSVFLQTQAVATSYSKLGYNVFISETFAFLTYIYPKSVRLTRVIGKKIGEFLVKLVAQGLKPEDLELVGLSLGAHIISYAAKHFYATTGQKPSRITGLDPAGPCFRSLPEQNRLNPSDAERVDVVHTNIDGFGMAPTMGHVDFYVNGGEFQPSDIPYFPCLIICSHIKSVIYWWQALENANKFIGIRCDSVQDARFANCYNNSNVNYLGLRTDFGKPGVYYLPTKNAFPYYSGKAGLKPENEIYTSMSRKINDDNGFTV